TRLELNPEPISASVAPAANPVPMGFGKIWMNIAELSAYIGLAEPTIYGMVSKKKIPVYKLGRLNRFNRSQIDEWLLKGQTGQREQIPEQGTDR
ncbi:MAG TPA: helix-turn-helix domain-containing protein, partial [Elusimicrobiales bacterium]|nr:helix-turn-helix domain-containing protein [Elusimicrobiales bacterium]